MVTAAESCLLARTVWSVRRRCVARRGSRSSSLGPATWFTRRATSSKSSRALLRRRRSLDRGTTRRRSVRARAEFATLEYQHQAQLLVTNWGLPGAAWQRLAALGARSAPAPVRHECERACQVLTQPVRPRQPGQGTGVHPGPRVGALAAEHDGWAASLRLSARSQCSGSCRRKTRAGSSSPDARHRDPHSSKWRRSASCLQARC